MSEGESNFGLARVDKRIARWVTNNPGLSLSALFVLGTIGTLGIRLYSDSIYLTTPPARVETELTPTPAASMIASADSPIPYPVDSEAKRLQDYLDNYIKNGVASLYSTTASKIWVIVNTPTFAITKVTTRIGIRQRDFPDTRSSEEIPTGGSGNGPAVKRWQFGASIKGGFNKLVVEIDSSNGQVQVWTARFSNEGGFPTREKPFPEFSRIADSEDIEGEFVKINYEDDWGNIIEATVDQLLRVSSPRLALPPYRKIPGIVK